MQNAVCLRSILFGLMLFAAMVLPPLGMAFGAGSMAAGLFVVVVMCVILEMASLAVGGKVEFRNHRVINVIFLVLVAIFLQGSICAIMTGGADEDRFWKTYALLMLFIAGGVSLTRLINRLTFREVDDSVKVVFYLLLLCGIVSRFNPSLFFVGEMAKSDVVFFVETSHFALSYIPILLYMMVRASSGRKYILLAVSLGMALLMTNLTFVVSIVLVAMITLPIGRWVFMVLLAALIISAIDPSHIAYYVGRLTFSSDNRNASTLVFMNGWERAFLNLFENFWLGVGFQQFGIVCKTGIMQQQLDLIEAGHLCAKDGATVGSKLVGEFGIPALMVLVSYVFYAVKSARVLKKYSLRQLPIDDPRVVFYLAIYLAYAVDIFVRGTGYFSTTGLFFISSLIWMAFRKSSSTDLWQLRSWPTQVMPKVGV